MLRGLTMSTLKIVLLTIWIILGLVGSIQQHKKPTSGHFWVWLGHTIIWMLFVLFG